MPYAFSLTPVKISDVPESTDVLSLATTLIESVNSWKKGKTIDGVQTYSQKGPASNGPAWHARISQHEPTEISFDQLWNAIGIDHFEHEKEYIPSIQRTELLKTIGDAQAWAIHYSFPSPVSPRVFTQLQYIYAPSSTTSPRTAYVVTLPFDVENDEEMLAKQGKHVQGRYVSIEEIRELEDGKTEWRMATCSTPGGSIPQFVSERSIPGEIAKDVPHLISWVKKQFA